MGSAVLVVSLPISLCTPTLLAGGVGREAEKTLNQCKLFWAVPKISLCCQHCFHHKCKICCLQSQNYFIVWGKKWCNKGTGESFQFTSSNPPKILWKYMFRKDVLGWAVNSGFLTLAFLHAWHNVTYWVGNQGNFWTLRKILTLLNVLKIKSQALVGQKIIPEGDLKFF